MLDFLLNPNVAYVLLVGGFLLAVLALFSPGTGVLEAGALVIFILAGWVVYNVPINLWALILLGVGVFPFLLALRRSQQLGYLAVSILALIVGSLFLFRGDNWWQPAVDARLAVPTSLLVGGFLWIVARKVLEAEFSTPSHNLNALIGAVGEAKSEIQDEGSVQVHGELWTASSQERIPAGASIRVVGREGFVLQVEPVGKEKAGQPPT